MKFHESLGVLGPIIAFRINAFVLVVISIFCLLGLFTWRRYFSAISDVPGPFAASFTRLWHMHRILKGDQNLKLIRLHEKHGHFVRISYDEVSVSYPDAISKVLVAPLHKAHWYKIRALPGYRFQSPMSTTDPKQKIEKSKYITGAYTVSKILRSEEHIDSTFSAFLSWLDKHASEKKPMDLDKYTTYATFDVIGEIVFSAPFGFLDRGVDIGNAISKSLALNAYIAVAGYFRWLNIALLANPVMTYLSLLPMGHLFDTVRTVLAERGKNANARYDTVQYWLKQHEKHPEKLSMREIGTQALAAVGAGSDTVSGGMQSFVYHMIRHPNAWARAREEVVEKMGGGVRVRFVQACIKEALRIFGPVPMGLPRIAPKGGLEIGGRVLPEGIIVSVNPWVMHHSKEIWGPDAHEFNPDRWLYEQNIAARENYWMPFGAGYGGCPGQNIAKVELAKMAATLVRDYKIKQVDATQEWRWKAYFTVVPHSWRVMIEERRNGDENV